MTNKLLIISMAVLMSGCEPTTTNNATNTNATSTNTPTADTASKDTGTGIDTTLLAGLYNTSSRDASDPDILIDKSYTYVSQTGLISVYDYQGDGAGTGVNCYSSPSDMSKINWSIDNMQIVEAKAIEGGQRYGLRLRGGSGNLSLMFNYSEAKGMHQFLLDNSLDEEIGITVREETVNGSVVNLSLGHSGSMKINTPSITKIRSMLCK